MTRHEMKGFLSFLIMWFIYKKEMTGAEIAIELEKRKGNKPSPGTIYPALKDLKDKGLIKDDRDKKYSLTKKGEEELDSHLKTFFDTFCDLDEMKSCCRKK
ncbi:TPA: PadR family transcriptional regulator [Candidatus Woesearchaeota archaeon]|nr:Transcriptional regulator PadR family protein [archaeon GW2011_AR15]MBS3103401.1 PadR family transcriptional regulator [Candidatus Woesearchaeota archaeon]HIH41518.1 PadR family transcriptional regulator [Candidatus Woesearchaeota archaeon]